MSSQHNLDIRSYSLYELLELFDLEVDNITVDSLKKAKKKVLMTHPDKSKMPKEYFLFYKKAFDVIFRMFENVQKVSQKVEDKDYIAECSDISSKEFQKSLNKISEKSFQKNFNELFEKHMKKDTNESKNEWFREEEALYNDSIKNTSQMGDALNRIKTQQQTLVKYNGVQPLQFSQGNNFYDDEDDDNTAYISSDPFSKLKFDDLRKVHKDQTVFSVQESDFQNIPKYNSVGDYERARDTNNIRPMEKTQAMKMVEQQEALLQKRIKEKQYRSELQTIQYIDSNKQVMSNFLRLT